ncbi:MAG: fimbria/pilus periplasmic chaperone [Terracidiphilus sp.]
MAAAKALAAIFFILLAGALAGAQALSVLPVTIPLLAGQKTTSLTITNQGSTETAVQIRPFAWSQKSEIGDIQLSATNMVMLSPPIARIAPGASQVVRLILRMTPETQEATYRILIDQVPPPAEAGVVHMVLRLSIPIFAPPPIRSHSDVQFHLERDADHISLVALDAGNLHDVIRDIALTTSDGRKLEVEPGATPYILSGATRRWRIVLKDPLPLQADTLRLTAKTVAGVIDEQVRFAAAR